MTDPHEDLVEAVARAAFHTWDKFAHTPRIEGEPGLDRALRGFDLVARAVIALIAERTKDATPEMIRANGDVVAPLCDGEYATIWSAMHRVSPLWPKEKA